MVDLSIDKGGGVKQLWALGMSMQTFPDIKSVCGRNVKNFGGTLWQKCKEKDVRWPCNFFNRQSCFYFMHNAKIHDSNIALFCLLGFWAF